MISQDFKEFIVSLNENDVEYLIVGGYAVAIYGHPRYTKDLDVWLSPTQANITKLLKALSDFGFESTQLKVEDFLNEDNVIQLGYPPNRIDLLTAIDGVQFSSSFADRKIIQLQEIELPVISLSHLIQNKLSAGRLQDLADAEKLSALQQEPKEE